MEEGTSPDERRHGLIQIVGEESIGLWNILDQILFYEELAREIQTTMSQVSGHSTDATVTNL